MQARRRRTVELLLVFLEVLEDENDLTGANKPQFLAGETKHLFRACGKRQGQGRETTAECRSHEATLKMPRLARGVR